MYLLLSGVDGGIGTGALGDMACHTTNQHMACELTQPTSVESVNTGPINDETFPWATIHMSFLKQKNEVLSSFIGMKLRLEMMAKQIRIKNLPPMDLFHEQQPKNSGLLLVGTITLYSPNVWS